MVKLVFFAVRCSAVLSHARSPISRAALVVAHCDKRDRIAVVQINDREGERGSR